MKTILVVEDSAPIMNALKDKLTKEGFKVIPAPTAKEATTALEGKEVVDVLWIDHYLGSKESGLDVLKFARESEKYKNLPAIVVSASGTDATVQAYKKLGIEKYYQKDQNRMIDIINDIREILKK